MRDMVRRLAEFHNVNINVMQAIYEDIVLSLKNDAVAQKEEPSETKSGEGFESLPASLKRILVVSSTYEASMHRFREMKKDYQDWCVKCSVNPPHLIIGKARFDFVSVDNYERIRGQEYHSVVIDEMSDEKFQQAQKFKAYIREPHEPNNS